MHRFKTFLMGLLSVVFVCGTLGLGLPQASQALVLGEEVEVGGTKNILKKIFPPCGPGTRNQRFVVSKDGPSVCDNTTGLQWQKSPSTDSFAWQKAIDHCANLELTGKHHKKKQWRLAEVKEFISLVDYSVPNQATNLNAPNGPFMNVQPVFYWSASELAGPPTIAWHVDFNTGFVVTGSKGISLNPAWCVSGGQDAH